MLVAVLIALLVGASAAPQRDVLIYAASSLQTVLDAVAADALRVTGVRMRVSYAASSALARQIENGAPADMFISADLDWMDYLAARKLIRDGSRVQLAGNRLVLIAAADRARSLTLKVAPQFPLAAALGTGRLALANPDAVPAGKYAKAALTSLGVWDSIAGRLAPAENVRGAMLLVSRGEAPLGIVYATDAAVDKGVAIVDMFPASSHPPIVYPAALTRNASPAAATLLEFLRSDAAQATFRAHGFAPPPR